jgi:hypothetical protein
VVTANPRQVRLIAEERIKTNVIDATVLARLLALRQARDAMAGQAAVQRTAIERWDPSRKQPRTSSRGSSVQRLNSTAIAPPLGLGQGGAAGPGRSHRGIEVVVRLRHLATALGFSP